MELLKSSVSMRHRKIYETMQLTLDDDYNVPDKKSDITKIIDDTGRVILDDVHSIDDHIIVNGNMEFRILYLGEKENGMAEYIKGSIPITETINADKIAGDEPVNVMAEIEDLSIKIINSRKVNVRALIKLTAENYSALSQEAAVGIDTGSAQIKYDNIECLDLAIEKKDTYRIKDEITLPSDKENIEEIIWEEIQPRALELRIVDEGVSVKGEIFLFILYEGNGEEKRQHWFDAVVPFKGNIECSGCNESMIPDIRSKVMSSNIEIKQDFDGEERIINLDMVLELDIRIYNEAKMNIIEDIYAIDKEITPIKKLITFDNLLMKNNLKCKCQESLTIGTEQENILFICATTGNVHVDTVKAVEGHVEINGSIYVKILYVAAGNDGMFNAIKGNIPFNQIVDNERINENCRIELDTNIEQLSTTVTDIGKIDIKAAVGLNMLIILPVYIGVVNEIEECPLDYNKLKNLPSITGYITGKDDTLWNIAKENYTSVEKIMEINSLTEEKLTAGQKILIL